MPAQHPSNRYRHRWWREFADSEQAAPDANDAEWQEHAQRFRPPWWPENESWPPARRHWPRRLHRPFFRRMGCLFLLFNLFVAGLIAAIVLLALNRMGLASVPAEATRWIAPAVGVVLTVAISVVAIVGTNLRRMSMPLDELLAASRRVAEGDYSVRVTPRGTQEVRTLAEAFNSMAEQLDAHEHRRSSMLADVTHELRTPLTIIQGNLEGMLDGIYAADANRLRSVLDETRILSRLAEDLRTLSLAESGALQLRKEPTDLIALAQEAIEAHQSQANSAGVKLDLSAASTGILQKVDPERIRQVLGNLISNAVRYSPRGSTVRVEITQTIGSAKVAVTDNGPGIAAADLPHVFERYYKSADSRGMGLGLSIAKYLVEAHGGKIGAESAAGRGTTIWFTLPG